MQTINKETQARIHSFESMGAVDGPGIRFVIFMQGCHLKCKYCQNRDTWDLCGGEIYNIDDIVNKILRYQNYMEASNGGVTISGGEPLLQCRFIINLFKELKKYNIHTAIDTSGIIEITEDIKELIELTDLFLLDIKCINDEVCKELIGKSNKKELEFAKYLNEKNKEIWIRQVLIPTITDREEDLLKLKEFISGLENIKKVEILPYHDMGKFKWENLNLKYELNNIRTANSDDVERANKILKI